MGNRYSRYILIEDRDYGPVYYNWANLDDSYKQVSMQNSTKHITYNDSHWITIL